MLYLKYYIDFTTYFFYLYNFDILVNLYRVHIIVCIVSYFYRILIIFRVIQFVSYSILLDLQILLFLPAVLKHKKKRNILIILHPEMTTISVMLLDIHEKAHGSILDLGFLKGQKKPLAGVTINAGGIALQ